MNYPVNKLLEECFNEPMVNAVRKAYISLFEAVKPDHATRELLKSSLPEPPDGWDSTAYNNDGDEVVSARTHSKMSWVNALEAAIRNEFFHDGASALKFEPGVTRIAMGELGFWPRTLEDWRPPEERKETIYNKISSLKRIVREISSPAHKADFNVNLNGQSYDELYSVFGEASRGSYENTENADAFHTGGNGKKYRLVNIHNFREATDYSRFVSWCICSSSSYWTDYSNHNTRKCYFLLAEGFEDEPEVPGEGCPKDSYGESMIGFFVAPNGSISSCCCRWNYQHGGNSSMYNKDEISDLIGMPFDQACPPYSQEELEEKKTLSIPRIDAVKRKLARYAARHVTIDQLSRLLASDLDTRVFITDYHMPEHMHKLTISNNELDWETVIMDNLTLPMGDEEFESVTPVDSNIVKLSSSYNWSLDGEEHDEDDYYETQASGYFLYKNGCVVNAIDLSTSNIDEISLDEVGKTSFYIVSGEDSISELVDFATGNMPLDAEHGMTSSGNLVIVNEDLPEHKSRYDDSEFSVWKVDDKNGTISKVYQPEFGFKKYESTYTSDTLAGIIEADFGVHALKRDGSVVTLIEHGEYVKRLDNGGIVCYTNGTYKVFNADASNHFDFHELGFEVDRSLLRNAHLCVNKHTGEHILMVNGKPVMRDVKIELLGPENENEQEIAILKDGIVTFASLDNEGNVVKNFAHTMDHAGGERIVKMGYENGDWYPWIAFSKDNVINVYGKDSNEPIAGPYSEFNSHYVGAKYTCAKRSDSTYDLLDNHTGKPFQPQGFKDITTHAAFAALDTDKGFIALNRNDTYNDIAPLAVGTQGDGTKYLFGASESPIGPVDEVFRCRDKMFNKYTLVEKDHRIYTVMNGKLTEFKGQVLDK